MSDWSAHLTDDASLSESFRPESIEGQPWEVVEVWFEPRWHGFALVVTEGRTILDSGAVLVECLKRRWRRRKRGSPLREVVKARGARFLDLRGLPTTRAGAEQIGRLFLTEHEGLDYSPPGEMLVMRPDGSVERQEI